MLDKVLEEIKKEGHDGDEFVKTLEKTNKYALRARIHKKINQTVRRKK
jgi:hypothetical protein